MQVRVIAVTVGTTAAFLLALITGLSESASAQEIPTALEEAIRQEVQARGEEYAGPCDETVLPDDVDRWCSEVEFSEGRASVKLGPTFSEFVARVVFAQRDGSWVEVGRSDLPSLPPAGSGTNAGVPLTFGSFAIAGLFGAAMLVASGAVLRRR